MRDLALSERENEVMVLLSDGKSRREIADEMCLAIQTVNNHVDGAFNKLGAINAPHAVRLFMENQGNYPG